MLKIKDSVDLKELEKFGFCNIGEIAPIETLYVNGNHTFNMCILIGEDKIVNIRAICQFEDNYFDDIEISELLFDLIKADLVEKV